MPLKSGKELWIFAGIATAVGAYFWIGNNFDPLFLVIGGVFVAPMAFLAELRFRRDAYVAFHDEHLVVSTYTWGSRFWTKDSNVVVAYGAIRDVRSDSSHQVELLIDQVEPPYEITETQASVTFKPKRMRDFLDELYRRMEDARGRRH